MKTPQISSPALAKILGIEEIYLKREDLHKYGSHKGRSIPIMIKKHLEQGEENFVISSSGNAALAAIRFVKQYNNNNVHGIYLTIYVGKKINQKKLDEMKKEIYDDENIVINQTEKPKQEAFKLDYDGKAKFLRQSTDEAALTGYFELATELDKIPGLEAVFIPTSSGTTAEAVALVFDDLQNNPQIHIVQTEYCHPIANEFDSEFIKNDKISLADAIVDNIAHRKNKVVELVKKSNGSGWVVNDKEIREAIKIVKENAKVDISANSALSIAGLKKALDHGWKFKGAICCLVTGK